VQVIVITPDSIDDMDWTNPRQAKDGYTHDWWHIEVRRRNAATVNAAALPNEHMAWQGGVHRGSLLADGWSELLSRVGHQFACSERMRISRMLTCGALLSAGVLPSHVDMWHAVACRRATAGSR
jgi:hypothetical protein